MAAWSLPSTQAAVTADTVAYWNFNQGTAGEPFSTESGATLDVPDLSGNEFWLSGWNATYGPSFSQEGETPFGTGLSARVNGSQDAYTGALGNEALNQWTPLEWTIEFAVKLDSVSGWRTIIGRDGSAHEVAHSDFYFQRSSASGSFRLRFHTVDGETVIVESDFAPVAGVWYALAVVSDGSNVFMYAQQPGEASHQLVGMASFTDPNANNALASSGGHWTIGRGWYNGSFVDYVVGNIDNVRFSSAALTPLELLAIPEQSIGAPLPGYVLVFEDDFQGTTLDDSKWRASYPWGSGHTHNHDAYCIPEQVSVENGKLVITADYSPNYNNTGYDYISGIINTHGRFHTTYGYIEARLKLPAGQGTWPAFWTLQDGWPPEIDIMEQLNNNEEFYTNYHWGPSWEEHYSSGQWIQRAGLMSHFNTYALEWTPDYLRWYFNGEPVRTFSNSSAIAESQNQYIILNLAVGGWPGPADPQDYPTTYEIDWVRVWKLEPTEPDPETEMHVAGITMDHTVQGPWYRGTATVSIADEFNVAVEGATVHGDWSGSVSGNQSAVTGSNGTVTFTSPRNRNGGTFTFTVTDVVKPDHIYNSGANSATSGTITVP